MSWKERQDNYAALVQAERTEREEQSRQERLESDLTEKRADIIAEGILEEFGVAQALEDVREGVWKEGSITQTRDKRGLQLISDPIATLRQPYLEGLRKKEKSIDVITLDSGLIVLGIRVEFAKGDPAEPKLVLLDSAAPIRLGEHILKEERTDMLRILRSSGWIKLVGNIDTGLKLNRDQGWSFSDVNEEVGDLGGENALERFNGSLIRIVNRRIGNSSFPGQLPGQVRASWGQLIDQFPRQHQLRVHGSLTVGDLKSWEREARGPNILRRTGLLFSGKSSHRTRV